MLQQGEHSELFDDPLFAKSQEWRLSTSGLSAGHHFHGTGYTFIISYCVYMLIKCKRFGAAYEDGYGINCMHIALNV